MINKAELVRWLNTIPDDSSVAVDDGGLAVVEIDKDGKLTGAYAEIGGTPQEEPSEEQS